MDILTHTISGLAAGTVVASYSKHNIRNKAGIMSLSVLGGAFPDIDAISLWSRFDETVGVFFGLDYPGKVIYSEKFWYSHHGFFHSVLSAMLFTLLIGLVFFAINKLFYKHKNGVFDTIKSKSLLLIAFFSAYILHLIEDIPTPAATWDGVRMFFPLEKYIGGTGDIWWWNNYDIFLIISLLMFLNLLILLFSKFMKIKAWKLTSALFVFASVLCLYQIKTRDFDFNYTGTSSKYQQYEQKSKEIQREILGEKLYRKMEYLDNKLIIYF